MRWLSLTLLLLASAAGAEQALDTLQQQLSGLQSLSGAFEQRVVSEDGEEIERSSGRFRLLRPDYFAWTIESPDRQELLAADGSLWHYDVELETATRRDIVADRGYSPLAILGGDADRLARDYRVEAAGDSRWSLKPRFEGADFSEVLLTFADGAPVAMTVRDALERTTEIRFSSLLINPALTAGNFRFEPPPGTDIYDNE